LGFEVTRSDHGAGPVGGRGDGWRRALAFLPSELATVALVLWATPRFYNFQAFSSAVWAGALAAWLGVGAATAAVERSRGPHPAWARRTLVALLGLALVGCCAKAFSGHVSWNRALVIAIGLGLAIAINRRLLVIAVGRGNIGAAEGVRWMLLQGWAAYAIHPYVRGVEMGAGDSYHYTISMADFITQLRSGIFPIFIGQTEFAFNGGIHTVRTAPYFLHLGGWLDLATLQTLTPYALSNLAVVTSLALAGVGTYTALLVYAPGRAWLALALSALYVLCPGILVPLYLGDMIATFMTVPMIPLWALGVALAADHPRAWRPWLVQGFALGALWWAHPPIAFWAAVLTAGAWVAILAREGAVRTILGRMAAATLVCAALAGYVFVSVLSLHLKPGPDSQATESAVVLGVVAQNWRYGLLPISMGANHLLGDLQIGYSLLAGALAAVLAFRARKSASVLFGCVAFLLVLLTPVPWITARLWSLVPHAVFDVTNVWPMQRFIPIMAGLSVFAAMAGLSQLRPRTRSGATSLALVLVVAVGWSLSQANRFIKRAESAGLTPEHSAQMFRPENVMLTRVSYLFFGSFPGYFSHSQMEPFLETRLLDAKTLNVIGDGSTPVPGAGAGASPPIDLLQRPDGEIGPKITIEPGETLIVRFDFLGRELEGHLEIAGQNQFREYALPSSGSPKSFGALPTSGRVIALRDTSGQPDSLGIRFFPNSDSSGEWPTLHEPFARVTLERFEGVDHVVQLISLTPFHAVVRAERDAILETPRVRVPGYRASVNGRKAAVLTTPDDLVGVRVPAGTSDVRVDYRGSPALRFTYWLSACAWFALAAGVLRAPGESKQPACL
jgi:hypothetical protein